MRKKGQSPQHTLSIRGKSAAANLCVFHVLALDPVMTRILMLRSKIGVNAQTFYCYCFRLLLFLLLAFPVHFALEMICDECRRCERFASFSKSWPAAPLASESVVEERQAGTGRELEWNQWSPKMEGAVIGKGVRLEWS